METYPPQTESQPAITKPDFALQTAKSQPVAMGFQTAESFEYLQRVAKMFNSSDLVPKQFQGSQNLGNTIVALNMSQRLGADPLAVMQNIYIVHGKPSWSSTFMISALNSCGRFKPLKFRLEPLGEKTIDKQKIEDVRCVAWTTEIDGSEEIESPPVTIEMAVKEGWFSKTGSKWKTMPELMLRYRAATMFARLYAPEILCGMRTQEEIIDVTSTPATKQAKPSFSAEVGE